MKTDKEILDIFEKIDALRQSRDGLSEDKLMALLSGLTGAALDRAIKLLEDKSRRLSELIELISAIQQTAEAVAPSRKIRKKKEE
jgi:hypothetical protein